MITSSVEDQTIELDYAFNFSAVREAMPCQTNCDILCMRAFDAKPAKIEDVVVLISALTRLP